MEVILKRDVPNVGRIGEVVRVKNGFARNFLLPRSLAVVADGGNKRALSHARRLVELEKIKVNKESQEKAKEVEKCKITLKKRFNAQGKMFGSVTETEIIEELKAFSFEFDRRDIELPEIRDAGSFDVKVRLPGDVFTSIQLKINAIKEVEKKTKKSTKGKKTKAKEKEEALEVADVEAAKESSNKETETAVTDESSTEG